MSRHNLGTMTVLGECGHEIVAQSFSYRTAFSRARGYENMEKWGVHCQECGVRVKPVKRVGIRKVEQKKPEESS
jgi:hypothetical protein